MAGCAVLCTGALAGGIVWHNHSTGAATAGASANTGPVGTFSATTPDTQAAPALSTHTPTSSRSHTTTPRTSSRAGSTAAGATGQHTTKAGKSSSTATPKAGSSTSATGHVNAGKAAGVVPVRANPDDATGADTKAAYSGSPDAAGTSAPDAAQQAYRQQKADVTPNRLPANRVYIPSVGIYSSIIPEKTSKQGLNIPSQLNRVAWATSTPGIAASAGTTVLAGHVTFGISHGVPVPAAFNTLGNLAKGAVIYTTDAHARVHAWRVSAKRSQAKDTTWYWHTTGTRQLILITCTGPWVSGSHRDNLIVTATPVAVSGGAS